MDPGVAISRFRVESAKEGVDARSGAETNRPKTASLPNEVIKVSYGSYL
jgi:hypothetical protein